MTLAGLLAGPTIEKCGEHITLVTARAVTELVADIGAQVRNSLVFHPKKSDKLSHSWKTETEF